MQVSLQDSTCIISSHNHTNNRLLTSTSKPSVKAFTKSVAFCNAPMSVVCLHVCKNIGKHKLVNIVPLVYKNLFYWSIKKITAQVVASTNLLRKARKTWKLWGQLPILELLASKCVPLLTYPYYYCHRSQSTCLICAPGEQWNFIRIFRTFLNIWKHQSTCKMGETSLVNFIQGRCNETTHH